MRSWIHFARGKVARQAHVGVGELGLMEDELGRQGFTGRVAELYRLEEPIGWTRSEGSLRSWDLDGKNLAPSDYDDPAGVPLPVFQNEDVVISVSRRQTEMPYAARNVSGDELFFVHRGTGTFHTEFGDIPYEPGDWILFPKGVTYRVAPDASENYFLITETVGEISFPDFGPIGRQAPFDPTLIFVPEPSARSSAAPARSGAAKEWEVRIKHAGTFTSFFYPHDPIGDVVGWKGDLFPLKLNIRDYRPLMSDRIHLMPTAYRIFEAHGVIICNVLPRPAESDPEAERIPPYHRNVDFDEFLFAHGGTVLGAAIEPASMTVTPQGLHHGLGQDFQKHAKQNRKTNDRMDAQLILIDTVRSLKITEAGKLAARSHDQYRQAQPKT
jgi:homogentisate 1,2-dioxygenase